MARDPRGGPLIPTPADAVPDDESQFDPDGVQHELRAARVLPERGFADVNDWLRRLYRDNVRHKINVKYLNGKTYEEILELIEERVAGPASSTVCNLPCFAATDGKSIQDTGISSSNILTSGRDSATPALDDLFGFWDDNDSGNPKKATLTALKTALGVGGGDVTANGSDGGNFAAAGFLIVSDGNNKVVADSSIQSSNVAQAGANITDNAIVRGDGGGRGVQGSGLFVSDLASNAVSVAPAIVSSGTPTAASLVGGANSNGGGGSASVVGGAGAGAGIGQAGNALLTGGSHAGGSGSGGNAIVDAGTGGLANGYVQVGPTNALYVGIGKTGIQIYNHGRTEFQQGQSPKVSRVTSNTTLDATYHVVLVDTDGGNVTITLPATPNSANGSHFVIKNTGGSGNTVTVARNGNNINGAAADVTLADGRAYSLYWDATERWQTVS